MHLISLRELAKMRPRAWLVPDLVPDDALVCLFGAPGSGKTFVALDLALTLASGLCKWQNIPLPPSPKQPAVVYVAGEGIHGLRDRVSAWASRHSRSDQQLYEARVCFVQQAVALNKEADVREFIDAVLQYQQENECEVRMVVFDTLARCAVGADENSSQEMGVVVDHLDKIRRRVSTANGGCGCTAMLVHHSGKASPSSMRGSSAVVAAVDAALSLIPSPLEEGSTRLVRLQAVKQKDGSLACARLRLPPHCESMVVVPAQAADQQTLSPAAKRARCDLSSYSLKPQTQT